MIPTRPTDLPLALTPITLRAANEFISLHHRHHRGSHAHRFAVSVRDRSGVLCGVAIAGNPIAKALNDGATIEVTRSCTDGTRNANSMLYGAIWRAARALGYTRMITYTMAGESGSSLRAIGMRIDGTTEGRPWSRPKRRREATYPVSQKTRWTLNLPA